MQDLQSSMCVWDGIFRTFQRLSQTSVAGCDRIPQEYINQNTIIYAAEQHIIIFFLLTEVTSCDIKQHKVMQKHLRQGW